MAREGTTNNPMLLAIDHARAINLVMGGAFVKPWEVEELNEDWLMAFRGILVDLPKFQNSADELKRSAAMWRAQHPTYRKYKH